MSEQATNRPFSSGRPIRRVGLLSPTSGNLGNATMQAATIANLRKRIPGVEIAGITLNPEETSRRHRIEAFPLAGASRRNYAVCSLDGQKMQASKPARTRQWLKQVPGLRPLVRAVRAVVAEITHFAVAAGVVRRLDRLIVPGGGALDDFWGGAWGHPWNLCKWTVLSRLYRVPFLFVSIGKSSLEAPLSRFFVRIALRLAAYRSYRDEDSKTAAQSLMDARSDPVYPDLAFSYPRSLIPDAGRNGSRDGRFVVGVSPMAYCDPRSWPLKDERRYTAYVSRLAQVVRWLINEDCRVLIFTTDAPDTATVGDLFAMIANGTVDTGAIQMLADSSEQSPDTLLKGISCADMVIASRLHGVILSHLNTIPVLALSFDPKVDAHMKSMGHQDYCLNIDRLSLDAVVERFKALKLHRDQEAAHIRNTAQAFRQQLDRQFDRILGLSDTAASTANACLQVETSVLPGAGGVRTR